MKHFLFLMLLFVFYLAGCQNDRMINNQANQGDIYISSPMPYTVLNHHPALSLPDSIIIDGKGNGVLDVFIDNKGQVEGFNLTFLKLANSQDTIRYYKYANHILKKNEYPFNIQCFIMFFQQYVSELELIRKDSVKLSSNAKYLIRVPMIFN